MKPYLSHENRRTRNFDKRLKYEDFFVCRGEQGTGAVLHFGGAYRVLVL